MDIRTFTVRRYLPGDVPEMTRLWQEAFGDSEHFISIFYKLLPSMGFAVVAEYGGQITAAAHMITGMEYVDKQGARTPCAYLYAVSVKKEMRGMGMGKAVVRAAAEMAKAGGCIVCTSPADKSLYGWYRRLIGTEHELNRAIFTVPAAGAPGCPSVSSAEYNRIRSRLLAGRPHMELSDTVMHFHALLCLEYGGGLFGTENGIAAVTREGGTAVLSECLSPDPAALAAAVAGTLGAGQAQYSVPVADKGSPYLALDAAVDPETVWNICFD